MAPFIGEVRRACVAHRSIGGIWWFNLLSRITKPVCELKAQGIKSAGLQGAVLDYSQASLQACLIRVRIW